MTGRDEKVTKGFFNYQNTIKKKKRKEKEKEEGEI